MDGKTLAFIILVMVVVGVLSSALTWVGKDILVPAPACICEPGFKIPVLVEGGHVDLICADVQWNGWSIGLVDGATEG